MEHHIVFPAHQLPLVLIPELFLRNKPVAILVHISKPLPLLLLAHDRVNQSLQLHQDESPALVGVEFSEVLDGEGPILLGCDNAIVVDVESLKVGIKYGSKHGQLNQQICLSLVDSLSMRDGIPTFKCLGMHLEYVPDPAGLPRVDELPQLIVVEVAVGQTELDEAGELVHVQFSVVVGIEDGHCDADRLRGLRIANRVEVVPHFAGRDGNAVVLVVLSVTSAMKIDHISI